jgi:hypothetical protein
MKLPVFKIKLLDYSELDQQIAKLKELRDSYHAANVAHFGEQLAAMLNS